MLDLITVSEFKPNVRAGSPWRQWTCKNYVQKLFLYVFDKESEQSRQNLPLC